MLGRVLRGGLRAAAGMPHAARPADRGYGAGGRSSFGKAELKSMLPAEDGRKAGGPEVDVRDRSHPEGQRAKRRKKLRTAMQGCG